MFHDNMPFIENVETVSPSLQKADYNYCITTFLAKVPSLPVAMK